MPEVTDDLRKFGVGGRTDLHASAVVGEDFKLENVVDGAPGHQGVHPAGVVADHSAQVAVLVSRRVGAKGEIELVGAFAQMIEHHARLNPRVLLFRIELDNLVEVLGEINNDGDVTRLAGQPGATPAW